MVDGSSRKDSHSSVRVGRRFLEMAFASGQFASGDRLPSLQSLSRQAKVSKSAMSRAVHGFAEAGKISILKNHGLFAGKVEDRVIGGLGVYLEKAPLKKWQLLRARLEQDIYAGRFPKGSDLPPVTDLAQSYGTSTPTLRKAMVDLLRAGVVKPNGRAFRVPRPDVMPGQAAIHYTAWMSPDEARLWFLRDRTIEFLASLGRACAESNLRLLVSSYEPRRGFHWHTGRDRSAASLRNFTLCAHIAFAPSLSEFDLNRLCRDLGGLHSAVKPVRVGTHDAPLAILDGSRGTNMSVPHVREFSATRIFSIARRNSGERIGRFLLAKGHRKIGYLSSMHKELWSKDRLLGIRRACEAAGFGESVKAFTIQARDTLADMPELAPAMRKLETNVLSESAEMERHLASKNLDWLAVPVKTSLEYFRTAIRSSCALSESIESMRNWGATACVGANDVVALSAMHCLRKGGLRVPEDVAIVGFDDDKFAAGNDLTSYNFNMSGIATAMLRYVLNPEKAPQVGMDGAVECTGLIIERGST